MTVQGPPAGGWRDSPNALFCGFLWLACVLLNNVWLPQQRMVSELLAGNQVVPRIGARAIPPLSPGAFFLWATYGVVPAPALLTLPALLGALIVSGLTAALGNQRYVVDRHATVERLAHVIDREKGDLHCR